MLLCPTGWEDVNKCLLSPNRVPATDGSADTANVQFGEPISFGVTEAEMTAPSLTHPMVCCKSWRPALHSLHLICRIADMQPSKEVVTHRWRAFALDHPALNSFPESGCSFQQIAA